MGGNFRLWMKWSDGAWSWFYLSPLSTFSRKFLFWCTKMCFIRLRKISLSAVAQLLGFSFCWLLRIPSWSRRQRALLRSDTVYRSDQISSCCINMKTIQDQIRDAKFTPHLPPHTVFVQKTYFFSGLQNFYCVIIGQNAIAEILKPRKSFFVH